MVAIVQLKLTVFLLERGISTYKDIAGGEHGLTISQIKENPIKLYL